MRIKKKPTVWNQQRRIKKNDNNSLLVPCYTYPVDTIKRAIQLVTDALTSLRGARKSLDIFSDLFASPIPSHTAIQNWVLQYGLYQLTSPIPQRDDWIFILDHTIEFGSQKCLVVLGITKEELSKKDEPIRHEQLRVLTAEISKKTNSQQIQGVLDNVIEETGVPVQMVSDHGSDLKNAIETICGKHENIRYTYDITHKCGLILKHALARDLQWNRFVRKYAHTKRRCVHSRFAFLAPKKLKDKSRWMNLDTCVDWAQKIIVYKQNMSEKISDLPWRKRKDFRSGFHDIFGWLHEFEERIQQWSAILEVVSIARYEVKKYGLRTDTAQRFDSQIEMDKYVWENVVDVINSLRAFLVNQTKNILPGEKFLGTSDIIESVFAKYKQFSARTPMKGVGKSVLTIPVFLSTVTNENVVNALKNISVQKVGRWIKDNVGQSVFAKRIAAFGT